jgi:hypothetical protein
MAGDTDWVVVPDSLDPAKAKAVIEDIWQQADVYYQIRGHWPDSVEQLIEENLIAIDSATHAQWEFDIGYRHYPSDISATPLDNTGQKGQIDCFWEDNHSISYKVFTGQWRGMGIPKHGVDSLTIEQQFDLTKEVRKALEDIAHGLPIYYEERGHYPRTVRDLEQARLMELTPGVYVQWEFSLVGDPPVAIDATSSHVMQGGKGQVVRYDIVHRKFSGYGVKE